MSSNTKSLLSTLAVLAATAGDALAVEFLDTANRSAAPLSRCEATAGDLVGNVALRLWSRHRDVLEGGNFRPYVEASIRNAWRDEIARSRRTPVLSDLQCSESASEPVFPAPITPATDDVAAVAVVNEFRNLLSPSDLEVLAHLESGRTDREIARLTNRTRHQIRVSVARIRRQACTYFGDAATA